jgi:hypothetical protein
MLSCLSNHLLLLPLKNVSIDIIKNCAPAHVKCGIYGTLKVHKHETFVWTFFAETETIWSQGPVTRDF